MTRSRTLLLSGLLAAVLAAPALAQDDPVGPPPTPQPKPDPAPQTEPAPPPAPGTEAAPKPAGTEAAPPAGKEREGRKRFERDQGQADVLKGQLERLLAVVKGADAKATGEALRSLAPDEKALKDAFTEAGYKELGAELLEGATKLFAGETPEILERLGLKPDLETVEVFKASTEDLLTMESGTDAAREFASGLRRTARLLEPRYHWYCAVLRSKVEGSPDCRLQLFFHSEGRWVLLGRIWRLDE
jgi:hypothetical protein